MVFLEEKIFYKRNKLFVVLYFNATVIVDWFLVEDSSRSKRIMFSSKKIMKKSALAVLL
jgi:hypothetical protein